MTNRAVFAVLLSALVNPAFGADPWHQSFNKVSTIPWRNNFLGGVAIGTGAVDGPAGFAPWSETRAFGGSITTSGAADFGDLKIYIEQVGEIADHRGTAISHQIYHVTDPAVAAGTDGTLYLAYTMGGLTTINGGPGNSVRASLSVTHNVQNNGIGGTLLEYHERTIGPPANAASGTSSFNVAVPFKYDEAFRVTSRFDVLITSDLQYDFFGATPVLSPASTFQSIIAAFDNSATLDAIYIPDGAAISLVSASTFDLSPLVRFGTPAPVPLPPAVALFFFAVLGTHYLARRGRSQREAPRG